MANVKFEGQDFELKTGPLNELVMTEFFAATADQSPDTAIAPDVMLALLEECIAGKDFARFRKLGRKTENFWEKALDVLKARMDGEAEASADFPTGQPAASTAGPETTPKNAESASEDKAWQQANGRPDVYAMLLDSERHLQAV